MKKNMKLATKKNSPSGSHKRLTKEKRFEVVPSSHPTTPPDGQGVPLPSDQTHPRKNGKHASMLRWVDDLWFGEEPSYLGMKIFTEEELAQHAKLSIEQVRMWISQHRLDTLPTSNGS